MLRLHVDELEVAFPLRLQILRNHSFDVVQGVRPIFKVESMSFFGHYAATLLTLSLPHVVQKVRQSPGTLVIFFLSFFLSFPCRHIVCLQEEQPPDQCMSPSIFEHSCQQPQKIPDHD